MTTNIGYDDKFPLKLSPTKTLRDEFALASMQVGLAINTAYPDENWRYGLALDAYKMADAMLAAREKK